MSRLRLLGRGSVQKQAVTELEALPQENRLRENVIKLVQELISLLAKRQNQDQNLDRDDRELIMTLTQMYEEAMAELRQEAKEEGLQEGLQQGLQQGKAEGEREAKCRLIKTLLRIRFDTLDEELVAMVNAIASLDSEEFTPLLLQQSREELLARFQEKGSLNTEKNI